MAYKHQSAIPSFPKTQNVFSEAPMNDVDREVTCKVDREFTGKWGKHGPGTNPMIDIHMCIYIYIYACALASISGPSLGGFESISGPSVASISGLRFVCLFSQFYSVLVCVEITDSE